MTLLVSCSAGCRLGRGEDGVLCSREGVSGMVDELLDRGDEVEQTPRTQSESEDDDLAVSLSALSRLSAVRLGLEDLLTEVATFAVQAIPGADGAGLTLIEANRADTIVKSAPFVREIDDIQYGLGEGPCISAAARRIPMRSGSLGGDPAGRGSARRPAGWGCTACCRCR